MIHSAPFKYRLGRVFNWLLLFWCKKKSQSFLNWFYMHRIASNIFWIHLHVPIFDKRAISSEIYTVLLVFGVFIYKYSYIFKSCCIIYSLRYIEITIIVDFSHKNNNTKFMLYNSFRLYESFDVRYSEFCWFLNYLCVSYRS